MTDDRRSPARFPLARSTLLEVPHRAGTRVASAGGTLWLTLDGDPRDIVLAAGEAFQVPPGPRALVYALDDAVLELGGTPPVVRPALAAPKRRWMHGLLPHAA